MTTEEKDLILKVCYASLLYGITVYVEHDTFYDEREPYKTKISIKSHQILDDFVNNPLSSKLLVRPYLRPMSSMTKEELKEFVSFTSQSMHRFICESTNTDHWYNAYEEEDWLLVHHFDYRGLIEKGLALEAPEGMYKLKQ